jgi:hypothetical protein
MPSKSKTRRRNKRGNNNHSGSYNSDDDNSYDDVDHETAFSNDDAMDDYLSESHTIMDVASNANSNTVATMDDDLEWDMEQDQEDYYKHHKSIQDTDAMAQAILKRNSKLAALLFTVTDFGQEKRSSKREQLLKSWFKALTQYATDPSTAYDIVRRYQDDLLQACGTQILWRGSSTPAEQYAACRVLEALAMICSNDDGGVHDLYEQLHSKLTRVVQSTHRATPVRAAALRTLGMIVFCNTASNKDENADLITEYVMEFCETILTNTEYRNQTTPTGLKTAAYQVWTLLATTLQEFYVSGQDEETTGRGIPLLKPILECLLPQSSSSDTTEAGLQLKEAAGQAVVYIHDARLRLGNYAECSNTTDAKYSLGSWNSNSAEEDLIDEITQAVYELAHASGHYMSKKAKKEQRQIFRDFLGMLQDQDTPAHAISFRGGDLELTTWKDIIAFEYIKRCLQGGLQIQLMTNPTIKEMLGAEGLAAHQETYSQIEKRLLLSKTSEAAKAKDQHRHKGRDKRNNIKNHFLTADGEDI